MQIKINNQIYEANLGETILTVCQREGIRIPTLCAHEDLPHEAVCRLCLVEVNKSDRLVTSCTFPVCEGLEVQTESEKIQQARKINLELLWADHAGKCVSCKKNQRCELQNLATEEKIENFRFVPRRGDITADEELELLKDNWSRVVVDEKNKAISHTTELCVECRRCINICPTREFGFNHRAGDVVVGTPYNQTLDCMFCGQCVKHCPTGALTDKNDLSKISADLDDLKKLAVAIVDPVLLASFENEFREKISLSKFLGMLRALGFEKVFSLSWGMERWNVEMEKAVGRKKAGEPILGAYCPSLSRYVKKHYPEIAETLLEIPAPEEMLAGAVKGEYAEQEKINTKNILVFVLSPCTAKKTLVGGNLNCVLSMRELGRLARLKKINLAGLADSGFDSFLGEKGLTEDYQKYLENVVTGMEDIDNVLRKIRKGEARGLYNLLVCKSGCENGGGQSR